MGFTADVILSLLKHKPLATSANIKLFSFSNTMSNT